MIDFLIILVLLAAISAGGIIYWMRLQMENFGYRYPFLNSSFKMIADFYSRMGRDKKLKNKYYQTLLTTSLIWIIFSISLWFITN
ncbi:hypothetical protein VOI54_17960 [Tamlana sp. 2201CG12-4]|uniref:hypothetical protein n=1 Tax=Tamlana sp. 2201CG12-4 TaxID=3112582 RepID=UPI002DBF15DD|nr:hypothetical protein [Tamlana sp. 2201CG12-4]MEC3908913.1 hypothetical protein [Tamlana sp. 2201CG12-4]